jgi:dephospho-CoA kinase
MMLKIGLTGNIGSGKSTVAGIFKILGIAVYHADTEAKKFLQQQIVIEQLIVQFGDKILTEDIIDRAKLAQLVFNDKRALDFLNQLIHPLVKTDFEQWMASLEAKSPYVVQEAAILFESSFEKYVDKTILVTAPLHLRMNRVMERDHISAAMFMQREANQWTEDKKTELASFVIVNDDTKLLIPQLMEIHQKLLKF